MLHLWSLGVEEQFYIAWPILIVPIYRRRSTLLGACCGLMLVSFIACVLLTPVSPSAAFYLPMTRFWELLAGALLAYSFTRSTNTAGAPPVSGASSEALAWAGMLVVMAGFVLIDRYSSFPGWWSLLPVIGATALIAAPRAWLNRRVLSSRPLVFIGLISYPLYLWHWILLTFLRIGNDGEEPPRAWLLAAVAAAFVLAWLTFKWVERPVRFSRNRDAMPRTLVGLMAAVGLAALAVDLSDGLAFQYPPQIRRLAAFDYDQARKSNERAYRDGTCLVSGRLGLANVGPQCVDAPRSGAPLIVLWGDSHAASLYPGLRELQKKRSFRIAQFTATGCPPVVDAKAQEEDRCEIFSRAVMQRIAEVRPDLVLIEAHWAFYADIHSANRLDVAALHRTLRALQDLGIARIVVMGSLPTWKLYQPRVAFEVWRHRGSLPARTREDLDPAPFAADGLVRGALSGTAAMFVPPLDFLCANGDCLIFADSTEAATVAWDYDHLSVQGSYLLIDAAAASIFATRDDSN